MADYTALVELAGDRAITAIKQAEDITVLAVSTVSKTVGGFLPNLPIPLAGLLPNPQKIVESSFGIAERIIGAQKSYAVNVLEALDPVTSKVIPNGSKTKSK